MKSRRAGCIQWGCIAAALPAVILLAAALYFAIDNARLPTASPVVERLSDLDKARLEEALHLKRELGDQVLPGWSSADIPQILYNEQYAFLVAYPRVDQLPPPGWMTVPQDKPKGGAWEIVPQDELMGRPYARVKLASSQESPQAFVVKVGDMHAGSLGTYDWMRISLVDSIRKGLPAFVRPVFPSRLFVGVLVQGSDQYITTILHENAHAYQAIKAPERLAAAEAANARWQGSYPPENEAFTRAWQAEIDLLVKALRSTDLAETRALAAQFIEQRRSRRLSANLSAGLIDFERQREWLEGIGRYAEITAFRLAATTPGYQPVKALSADPEFSAYRRFDFRWSTELDQLSREAGAEGEERFYYTGCAQAVLLDRLSPGWKEKYFDPGVWLEDLLAQAVEK